MDPVTRPASASSTVSASASDLLLDCPAPTRRGASTAWGGASTMPSGTHRSVQG